MFGSLRHHTIALLFAVGLIGAGANAADFFVSPGGNDTNAGNTPAAAWKTITRVNDRAWSPGFQPGDRIYLEGGQTFTGQIYVEGPIRTAGTATNPITFTSYGSGRARVLISDANQSGFYAYNAGGIVISNLDFIGPGYATTTKAGVSFYADAGAGVTNVPTVTVREVNSSGFKEGVSVGAWSSGTGYHDILVTDVNAFSNKLAGIFFWGPQRDAHHNAVVRRCSAWKNFGLGGQGNGILLNGVTGGLVEHCVAHENGSLGNGGVGIWTYGVDGVTIQLCESFRNRTSGAQDGGGFDFDGGTVNSVMQFNYSHDNDGAGYLFAQYNTATTGYGLLRNNVMRFNISENDGRRNSYASLFFWGASASDLVSSNDVYHNTFFLGGTASNGAPACVRFLGSSFQGLRIRNNVFVARNGFQLINADDAMSTNLVWHQGNVWWATTETNFRVKWGATIYTNLASWRSATTQERVGTNAVGLSLDPRLVNPGAGVTFSNPANLAQLTGYTLQPESPLLNAGLNLTALFGQSPGARDYFGNALPQGSAPDIGTHEFPLTPFDSWRHTHFGTNWTQPALAGPTADPDGDSFANLLEYAVGTLPLTTSGSAITLASGAVAGTNFLTLTYTRSKAATDVVTVVEAAHSLAGPWLATTNEVEQQWQFTDGPTNQTITARDRLPIHAEGITRRFLRLQVLQP